MVQKRALLEDARALNDPLLEEVRGFYETNHAAIESSRRRHGYYYGYLERVLRARIPAGERILDLGCGSGHLLAALEPAYGVGIDVSAEWVMTACARTVAAVAPANEAIKDAIAAAPSRISTRP